jgi:hypothetical protein
MQSVPGTDLPIPWWSLVSLLLAVGALIYVPGYLLALIVHRKRVDPIILLADAPVFAFVFFSCFALAAYLLSWTWGTLAATYGLGAATLAVFCWRSRWHRRSGEGPRDPGLLGFTALISLCLAILSLGAQWIAGGDSAIHLQVLTRMAHRPIVAQPTYSLLSDIPIWDHAYDTYYPLFIVLRGATGLDLYVLWRLLSALWIVPLPFALVAFARELSRSRTLAFWVGAMTLLVPLFAEPMLRGPVIGSLVYPGRYLLIHLPVALRFAIAALRTGEQRAAVTAATIIAASVLLHQEGILIFGLTLVTYGVLLAPLGRQEPALRAKRTLLQLAYVAVFALPLIALKWPYSREFVRLGTQEQQWHRYYSIWMLSDKLYAFPFPTQKPWTVFAISAACIIVGVMIASRWVERRRHRSRSAPAVEGTTDAESTGLWETALFASASFLGPLVTRQNAFVVPWLASAISYVGVNRLVRAGQPMLLCAFLAWVGARTIASGIQQTGMSASRSRIIAHGVIALVAVAAFARFRSEPFRSPGASWTIYQPTLVEIGRLLEPDSIVLAPKKMAANVVEFSPVRVPTFRFNGPVDLVELSEENQQMTVFFSTDVTNEDRVRIAAEYGAKYALLDRRYSEIEPLELHQLGTVLYEDSTYTLVRLPTGAEAPVPGAAAPSPAVPPSLSREKTAWRETVGTSSGRGTGADGPP